MHPSRTALIVATVTVAFVSVSHAQYGVTEKLFVSAGRIEMQLGAGTYMIRRHQIPTSESPSVRTRPRARVALTANATRATIAVTETPSSNFQATIEVPKTSDLFVRLSGGNLVLSGITGNKDIDSVAGNAEIAIGDLNDYASMEATVKAGDLNVGAFTGAKTTTVSAYFTRQLVRQGQVHAAAPISARAIWCCGNRENG
jgi:hypothetical protein